MKVTPDTNFFISATQWDNSVAHKVLLKFLRNNVEIYTTLSILEEVSEVLQRDFKYTLQEVHELIQKISSFLIIICPTIKINFIKDDPDDNKILECAVQSQSNYILSYDKKYLLIHKEYQGIKIVQPEEFLHKLP